MGRKGNLESQLDRIIYLVIREDFITGAFVQRKLGISYLSAMKVLNKLEELGYIEKGEDFTKRKVIKQNLIQ
jgi:Mn-dependent DtxR family transcriptional regulator